MEIFVDIIHRLDDTGRMFRSLLRRLRLLALRLVISYLVE